jgi:hypothetical protein
MSDPRSLACVRAVTRRECTDTLGRAREAINREARYLRESGYCPTRERLAIM